MAFKTIFSIALWNLLPLSKFGMFASVDSYTMCFLLLFPFFTQLAEETRFLDFWWENKKVETFKERGNQPPSNETIVEK